jgi:hypothetical protein
MKSDPKSEIWLLAQLEIFGQNGPYFLILSNEFSKLNLSSG